MKDYYLILNVSPTSTQEEIKKAYRQMSFKYHPDKNSGDQYFEERFKDISEAYQILSNINKRKEYDYLRLRYENKQNEGRYNRSNESSEILEWQRRFKEAQEDNKRWRAKFYEVQNEIDKTKHILSSQDALLLTSLKNEKIAKKRLSVLINTTSIVAIITFGFIFFFRAQSSPVNQDLKRPPTSSEVERYYLMRIDSLKEQLRNAKNPKILNEQRSSNKTSKNSKPKKVVQSDKSKIKSGSPDYDKMTIIKPTRDIELKEVTWIKLGKSDNNESKAFIDKVILKNNTGVSVSNVKIVYEILDSNNRTISTGQFVVCDPKFERGALPSKETQKIQVDSWISPAKLANQKIVLKVVDYSYYAK